MANTTPALGTLTRALDEWRCTTHINWLYGGTTDIDSSGSGRCVVRFGRPTELAAGVLGTMHWVNYSCLDAGHLKTFVSYYDMVISPNYPWNYGPQAPQASEVDLQTIMAHELGHAHVINHVNGPQTDFMHSTTPNGVTIRALSPGNVTGGNIQLSRSLTQTVCGVPSHRLLSNCTTGINESLNNSEISIYPNPASSTLIISGTSAKGYAEIYDHTGRKILNSDTKNKSTEFNISTLASGYYVLRYREDDELISTPFIKE